MTGIRPIRVAGGVALAALLAALAATGALATGTGSTASGRFAFASDYTAAKTKQVNIEISQFTYKGELAGVGVDYGSMSIAADGSFKGSGTEYCAACTIGGKVGAFTATYTYTGSGATYQGRLTFVRGYGKLAGIRGGGTFGGNVKTNANTYTYSYTLP